jgi:hypothetical protein
MAMQVHNDCLNEPLIVTRHARERFAERGEGDMADAVRLAVPYGGQYGSDMLLLAHAQVVFPTRRFGGVRRIVTTLTKAQAVVNLQDRGGNFVEADLPKPKYANRNPQPTGLATFAVKHVLEGTPRKKRAQELADAGYDMSGKAGDMYRCARESVELAFAKCDVLIEQAKKWTDL